MRVKKLQVGQSGASLVVSLIMLMVITLLALSAIKSSTINLLVAGNMQARDEARAAGQQAIETFISSYTNFFPNLPAGATTILVDIDNSGSNDYQVSVARPVCRRAAPQIPPKTNDCANGAKSGLICWDTLWDVTATSTDNRSGVTQTVTQGISITLDPSFDPTAVGC